jgi:hypothetical protein
VHHAIVLVLAAVVLGGCKGGSVDTFRLEHDAETLQSLAADGAMTAHSVAKGDATNAFAKVHAAELAKEARELADVLESAHPQPRLAVETRKLIEQARRVSDELSRLEADPGDRAVARQVRDALEDAAERAEKLGKSA